MSETRVVLTASHLRADAPEVLAELLRRNGVTVAGILAVSVFNLSRFRSLLRQRGLKPVLQKAQAALHAARKLPSDTKAAGSPIAELLAQHDVRPIGLRAWCRRHRVPLRVVKDLNERSAVNFVTACAPDLVVYSGGGILRARFLEVAGRVLNAHAGPLPAIRGMNAAEWSVLLHEPAEVTVHFIDQGIDTGTRIAAFPYARLECRTVAHLREATVAVGIEGLLRVILENRFRGVTTEAIPEGFHRQCFIMAPALVEIVQRRLAAESAAHRKLE